MGMTGAMQDVTYDGRNFNYDAKLHRHPMFVTERHFKFHLVEDEVTGYLRLLTSEDGSPIVSPRRLRDICINRIVTEPKLLRRNDQWPLMPGNVYQPLLGEAILLRETRAIVWLVSTWPTRVLRIYDVIPIEDTLEEDYMTKPFERNMKMSLIDCFVLGLLKLKPECNLKFVDFSGFDKDRKLCREICRLPILWMKPEDRTVEKIHETVSQTTDISKDKVQRFLNRISVVYGNVDGEFKHGNKIDQVTVFLDLQILIDDVPIGLSLQHRSPFRFSCSRLWMTPIKEVGLQPGTINVLIDSKRITHFEYREPTLPTNETLMRQVFEAISNLPNLFAISLPCGVDVSKNQQMAGQLNAVLLKVKYLQRLNFGYCNLRGQLSAILGGLTQKICYLNLKDCRLDETDLFFLVDWRPLYTLRELDLSSNDLQHMDQVVLGIIERMPNITCLSVACCSLGVHTQVGLARAAKECSRLRVLCLQGYTPLSEDDTLEMLKICSQIRTLQKFLIFPRVYAFPGDNDQERERNKLHALATAYRYLTLRKRLDMELE